MLAATVALLVLSGCPLFPQLSVTPRALDFGEAGVTRNFTILNSGGGVLDWVVEEVVRANPDAPWTAQDVPWLAVDPASGSTTRETDRVTLTANRSGQAAGQYTNTGVRIVSNAGTEVIPVAMSVTATLIVSPTQFTLSGVATSATFSISNIGAQSASWEVLYVPDPQSPATTQPLPPGITVAPATGTTASGAATAVSVSWAAGQDTFYLRVVSAAGSQLLSFVFGAQLQGLEVTPSPLTLYVDSNAQNADTAIPQTPSRLTIRNVGAVVRNWTVKVVNRVSPNLGAPISVAPSSGATPAGQESQVQVAVSDPRGIVAGSGTYDLIVESGDGSLIVPLVIEILPIPAIAISDAPNPEEAFPTVEPLTTLDFGREEVQKEFWVVNTGSRGSRLYFRVTHDDQGVTSPLIVDVVPIEGDTTGADRDFYIPEFGDFVDGVPVKVTVDRSNMTEDIEFRTVTVEAFDADFQFPLDAVEKQSIQIRVERPPLRMEGTLNRSRPPYVERFVFMLRDTVGRIIPTRAAEDLARLQFLVYEDEVLIDPRETNQFVSLPDDLRVNLVLMLDFTGSMFFAGTEDPITPLAPGEAIEIMKQGAALFLDDLPASYRVAIMYYNDRQQLSRVIHQFSTDRNSLKAALEDFTLPTAQHGVSTVRDALIDAMNVLLEEDPAETLPFDDADVRALVYITDGVDNASAASENDVLTRAEETRVRLYPIAYSANGETVNYAELLVQATDSGGHLYAVNDVEDLTRVLGSERSLVLEPSMLSGPNLVYFNVGNVGASNLSWNLAVTLGQEWISNVAPSGSVLLPGESAPVAVSLNPSAAPLGSRVEGEIAITSGDGAATIVIRMTPADDGLGNIVASNLTVSLQDEPGTLWNDLRNQVVFTYITPKEVSFSYRLVTRYTPPSGPAIQGQFQRDGVFFPGDVLAGQIAMTTTGIVEDLRAATPEDAVRAEVFVRTDYVPRNVNRFRMRFFTSLPPEAPAGAAQALASAQMRVRLAPGGLLDTAGAASSGWRLLSEGDGVYLLLTEEANALRYGAFGNLLAITFTGLDDFVALYDGLVQQPEFSVEMRADNQLYVSPATPGRPSDTKFFLYPAGPTYPDRRLSVKLNARDVAAPARTIEDLAFPGINPEAPKAWDRDDDGLSDFADPFPDDDGRPGNLVVPSPLQIGETQNSGTLTIRNNRLDTFEWDIDPGSIPSWISSITYGSPAGATPKSVLSPGESELIHLGVNRAGLPGGSSVQATLIVRPDVFLDEEVTVRLFTPELP